MSRVHVVLVVAVVAVAVLVLALTARPADEPGDPDPPEDPRAEHVPTRTPVPVVPAPAPPEIEPETAPVDAPGALRAIEPYVPPVGVGLAPDVDAFLIRYVTRGPGGHPAESTGLLFVPPGDGPMPLVAMGHGSTGIAEECAPSSSLRPLATIPGVEAALAQGWAVVATDFVGLGTPGPHPYLVGDASSRAILDSIAAAQVVVDVDPDRVAIWGYSQGGHAALHAADEVSTSGGPDLAGVVAFAPVTDLAGIVEEGHGTTLGTLFLVTTAVSWSEVYDELDLGDVVPEADRDLARSLARRCLDPVSIPVALLEALVLRDGLLHPAAVPDGRWDPFIAVNTPPGGSDVPLLVLHGARDEVIPAEITRGHVEDRCDRGGTVELRVVPLVGHLTLLNQSLDQAVEWTRQRFDGAPVEDACPGHGTPS